MTAFLPPNLLALFAPRDPIPYLSPLDKPSWLKRPWPYHGIAPYVREFEVSSAKSRCISWQASAFWKETGSY